MFFFWLIADISLLEYQSNDGRPHLLGQHFLLLLLLLLLSFLPAAP